MDVILNQKINKLMTQINPTVINQTMGLMRFRASLAKVKAGANIKIDVAVVGDSIVEGGYAGGGAVAGANTAFRTLGFVGRMRSSFANKFGNVGLGFVPVTFPAGGGLWTFGGSWTLDTSYVGITGQNRKSIAIGNTATIPFNGTGIGFVLSTSGSSGTFTVSVDGGAAQNFDANSGSYIYYATKGFETTPVADGDHVAVLTTTSTGNIFLIGSYPIKGSSGVNFHCCARWGTLASDQIVANALTASIDVWNPALTIIAVGANDYTAGTSLASYQTSVQAIITRAKSFGDVLLVSTGLRTEVGVIPQLQYNDVLRNLALINNVAFVDIMKRWNSDANYAKNTLGFISDTVHPNDYGHQDIANALVKVLVEDY